MFRGVLGVICGVCMVLHTCITGVRRCKYGNEGVYIRCINDILIIRWDHTNLHVVEGEADEGYGYKQFPKLPALRVVPVVSD